MKSKSTLDDKVLADLTDLSFARAPSIAGKEQARVIRGMLAGLFGKRSGGKQSEAVVKS